MQRAITLKLEVVEEEIEEGVVGDAISLVDRTAGGDMGVVTRLRYRQAVITEVEACTPDILPRADITSGVEVGYSPRLSLEGLTAQVESIGGNFAIQHSTDVALYAHLSEAPSKQAYGSTLAFRLCVSNKDTHTVAAELGDVLKSLTLEASTLKDDKEGSIE